MSRPPDGLRDAVIQRAVAVEFWRLTEAVEVAREALRLEAVLAEGSSAARAEAIGDRAVEIATQAARRLAVLGPYLPATAPPGSARPALSGDRFVAALRRFITPN
jgi:hypothetical protein